MSEIWPSDVIRRVQGAGRRAVRPFKCLLLMPSEARFNAIAEIIRRNVDEVFAAFPKFFEMPQAEVNRLDWVMSSGIIQTEIWEEIATADLVFCDITGFNPNVMFEAGVSAAWKALPQVVFIRDRFFKQPSPFDIAPFRYTEYELTSDGIPVFAEKVKKLTADALVAFPDDQIRAEPVALPADITFGAGRDDLRIYTPPFAHRRVVGDSLEFGSLVFFGQSWASLGDLQVLTFQLQFEAAFRQPVDPGAWIGVGLRSQHYWANFSHLLYLKRDGSVVVTEPNEQPPEFYSDRQLRAPCSIASDDFHKFEVKFGLDRLGLSVDDFATAIDVSSMPKQLGPGIIRFQSSLCWIAVRSIHVAAI